MKDPLQLENQDVYWMLVSSPASACKSSALPLGSAHPGLFLLALFISISRLAIHPRWTCAPYRPPHAIAAPSLSTASLPATVNLLAWVPLHRPPARFVNRKICLLRTCRHPDPSPTCRSSHLPRPATSQPRTPVAPTRRYSLAAYNQARSARAKAVKQAPPGTLPQPPPALAQPHAHPHPVPGFLSDTWNIGHHSRRQQANVLSRESPSPASSTSLLHRHSTQLQPSSLAVSSAAFLHKPTNLPISKPRREA